MASAEELLMRSIAVKRTFLDAGGARILDQMAEKILNSLRAGGVVYLCGNGGSAADCQHIAGEFIGRFMKERAPLPCVALTTDTSVLTCLSNDYGFDNVFQRQIDALVKKGDVLLALSTSGNSPNILRAIESARKLGAIILGFSGRGGGEMAPLCDLCLIAPADESPRIQELHITAAHVLCELVEEQFFA